MHEASVRQALVTALADSLQLAAPSIDSTASFDSLGMDSLSKVAFVPTLEKLFGCALHAEVLFDFPTVETLACHIHSILATNAPSGRKDVT
jgi:acyl carrier protein